MQTNLLIGMDLVPGLGPGLEIIDPATGATAATVPAASREQTDSAIMAAAEAFPGWRDATQDRRSQALRAIAGDLESEREDIAHLLSLDTGRPYLRNLLYVDFAATVFRQYAELARSLNGSFVPANDPQQFSITTRAPYGVIGVLVPWNYPLDLLAFKVAPAIATGNTVVVKGAAETTLSTLRLAEIFRRRVPGGVVNIVAGGREVGATIVSHRDVDMVAFTGSTAAGRAIGQECASLTKPAHLELGGKDPAIVCSDVDATIAARGVVWAAMLNAGQVCTATERAYVHRSRYDEFVDRAVEIASTLRVGDPLEPDTQIGPMRTEAGRDKVRAHVASAVESGATVLTGGSALDRPGFFFQPTVMVGVDHSMDLMREETFGPVLPIMPFDDVDEAFRLAADTEYGLGASIYTRDPVLVERAVRELRVGGVWVNDPVVDNPAGLLAGTRASGNGRELGIEGLHAFTTVRHLHWNLDLVAKPWWYPGGDR
jgi:betaine-aldehyde dehydrogenase